MDNIKITDAGLLMQAQGAGAGGFAIAFIAALYIYFFSAGIVSILVLAFGLLILFHSLHTAIKVSQAQEKFINQGK